MQSPWCLQSVLKVPLFSFKKWLTFLLKYSYILFCMVKLNFLAIFFFCLGNPCVPEFHNKVVYLGAGSYRISWDTTSYEEVLEYRLLYRQVQVQFISQLRSKMQ